MPEMNVRLRTSDFRAYHGVAEIGLSPDGVVLDGFCKTGPAGFGIEFILRTEQGNAGNNIDIDAFLMIVPVFVLKRRFCGVAEGDIALERRHFFFGILSRNIFIHDSSSLHPFGRNLRH